MIEPAPVELRERVTREVDKRFEAEQVPWLERLVEVPSCTREREDVEAAAHFLDETAAGLRLTREVHPDPDGTFADHRVYTTPAVSEATRAIALVGHVDTVFPRSLGFLDFERDDDVIRGPGVLDMKSGLSSIFFALTSLRASAPERYEALRARVVVVTDEEVGSPSSAPLYAGLAPVTSAALVFEAGRAEDRIVTRRKGSGVFRIEAHGKDAHAGNRHADGVSAIHALALLIPRIEGLTDYERGVTVNVGLIEGGSAKNTVPAHAACVIDVRFTRIEDGEWLKSRLSQLVADPFDGMADVPPRLRSATFELGGGITRPPMEPTDASLALFRAYGRYAAAEGLGSEEAPLQGGGSDANLLSAGGVPCIDGLGPAGANFHQVTEHSSLKSLRARTRALALLLLDIAGTADSEPPSTW